MNKYRLVVEANPQTKSDISAVLDAVDYYEKLYNTASKDLDYQGKIVSLASKIPGMHAHRYAQLQDLEAILEYIEEKEKCALNESVIQFMEHYKRSLTYSQAKDYAEASSDVQELRLVKQRVGIIRSQWLGIVKGIEYMHFQITNVSKLHAAGVEDAMIDTRI